MKEAERLLSARKGTLRHFTVMVLHSNLAKRVAEMLHQLNSKDLFLVLAALPIIALLVLAPETFELFWSGGGKLGRGDLFFVLFFLAFDLLLVWSNTALRGRVHQSLRPIA